MSEITRVGVDLAKRVIDARHVSVKPGAPREAEPHTLAVAAA